MLIDFTLNELLFIDDELTAYDSHSEEIVTMRMPNANPATIGAHLETIRKIGGAILEAFDRKTNVSVDLEFYEVLIIRELARSTKTMGDETVGLNLKRKVYQALQRIEAEEMIPLELSYDNGEEIIMDKTAIQEKMTAFQEEQNNARNKNTRKNKTSNKS
ncbi:hypothetical protein HYS94_02225 [Candidatus Daviesbacteria bacterium]|nr:hypothetical protein [Candidatus Daviesbacteria bacterium]